MARPINELSASPEQEHEAHPGTVIIQFTRLLLCNGKRSKVLTTLVLRAMPLAAILDPVRTPPVVIIAAPPAPPRNPAVPEMPTVVKAAPKPPPITGSSKPTDSPITSPPPAAITLILC